MLYRIRTTTAVYAEGLIAKRDNNTPAHLRWFWSDGRASQYLMHSWFYGDMGLAASSLPLSL
jgi:hypothetical protein